MPGVTKITIKHINKLCKNKNVMCISNCYTNSKEKLTWKCLKCSFEFVSSKNNFDRYFKHCKNCYYNNGEINENTLFLGSNDKPRYFYKHKLQLDVVLKSKNGKLLSKYNGSQKHVNILCANGHKFSAKFCNIVNTGTWCPECSDKNISISENIVRKYFEEIFGAKFPKQRPDWLKNKETGYNLELDGYCEELGIAFEHQGPHHYIDEFKNGRLRYIQHLDLLKAELCIQHNVKLFVINHLFKLTKLNNLFSEIQSQAHKFNIVISEPGDINISECYYDDRVDTLIKIAKEHGGKLLDTKYFGSNNKKVKWKCANGHIWKQYPYVIKRGSWCPVCAGYKINTKLGCNIIKD